MRDCFVEASLFAKGRSEIGVSESKNKIVFRGVVFGPDSQRCFKMGERLIGLSATGEKLATNVEVPGLNSLRINDVALDIVRDERNEPDQVLLIYTSFSVRERLRKANGRTFYRSEKKLKQQPPTSSLVAVSSW